MSAAATTAVPPVDGLGAVRLTHLFADALPELALPWQAEDAPDPQLIVLDEPLAGGLGLDAGWLRTPAGVRFLVGGLVPEGARPVVQCYAGHQFGGYSPRLGDGRALLLGELTGSDGALNDLHLKGSGRTPFARAGDGRATLGPMLREHVVSTAMHALGIPTTRALAVVATGRPVQREELLPGAVLVRVASSHLRVGSFQYARATGDPDLLRRLADHAVSRHEPAAALLERPSERYRALLDGVVARQAELVARWMLVGFVHGVMNTDNVTVSGETIDYGPCAFLDAHDPAASFSSIDTGGRYAYGQQPAVAEWDLARLAEAVLPLLLDDGDLDAPGAAARALELATESLGAFRPRFAAAWTRGMRAKLGLAGAGAGAGGDADVDALVQELEGLMTAGRVDHTSFFQRLSGTARGGTGPRDLLLDPAAARRFDAWAQRWLALAPDPALMDRTNPVHVPRNHLVEEALAAAVEGDQAPVERLVEVVSRPFEARPGQERYAEPAPEAFGAYTTFCGT